MKNKQKQNNITKIKQKKKKKNNMKNIFCPRSVYTA